ncbi:MAG: hypothetical protein BRC58_01240 [Cyanobacteria bacterium QS_8_64_29]|nr:MAG: hypothetical protein BRC58_01240 [Cyanobacteria bacterium QS_8_64_29]
MAAPADPRSVSERDGMRMAQAAFRDLEGRGISAFEIFNALADLYHQRGDPELSQLMAEAAYRCFQRD